MEAPKGQRRLWRHFLIHRLTYIDLGDFPVNPQSISIEIET